METGSFCYEWCKYQILTRVEITCSPYLSPGMHRLFSRAVVQFVFYIPTFDLIRPTRRGTIRLFEKLPVFKTKLISLL